MGIFGGFDVVKALLCTFTELLLLLLFSHSHQLLDVGSNALDNSRLMNLDAPSFIHWMEATSDFECGLVCVGALLLMSRSTTTLTSS